MKSDYNYNDFMIDFKIPTYKHMHNVIFLCKIIIWWCCVIGCGERRSLTGEDENAGEPDSGVLSG